MAEGPPLITNTIVTNQYTDQAQTNVDTDDWNWSTYNPTTPRTRFSFVVHPQQGLWHYSRGNVRPALDRGIVIASSSTNRLTILGDPSGLAVTRHELEYGSTGEKTDQNGYWNSTTNGCRIPRLLTQSDEWWLIECYVTMPSRSVVKSTFNGWELRHGTSGRRTVVYCDPEFDEDVPISLCVIHRASIANIPNLFYLYYAYDGTQVTDARDGCKFHRISQIRLVDSRL